MVVITCLRATKVPARASLKRQDEEYLGRLREKVLERDEHVTSNRINGTNSALRCRTPTAASSWKRAFNHEKRVFLLTKPSSRMVSETLGRNASEPIWPRKY
jgi:hypothetical protein